MVDLGLLLGQLLAILVVARVAGYAIRPLGQPRVIGEMLAGIALGPSFLGSVAPDIARTLFPPEGLLPLAALSQLGVILFMFVVGLRLDVDVLRDRARAAVAVSHASIVVPFVLGAALAPWLHPQLAGAGRSGNGVSVVPFALFLGAAMSVTAFPVLARILAERGLVGTQLGAVAIACAAVGDVTAWCILAGAVAVARAEGGVGVFMGTLLAVVAFAVLAATLGRRALITLERRRRGGVTPDIIGLAVIMALASALVTESLGVHALFGAFLAGAITPRASGLARDLAEQMEGLVATAFLPVFFAYTGLRTEIGLVSGTSLWAMCIAVIAAAIAGKLGGSVVAARLAGMSWREGTALGVLMNTRGLMELVVLNVGLELGVISPTLFAMMVLMALLTTCMTTPLVRIILRRDRLATTSAAVPPPSAASQPP
jgi:Kef-type K+ transport system membrane component KefB